MDIYTYISFVDLNTGKRNIWKCVAEDDTDAMNQFYNWCEDNSIEGMILEIS